MVLPLPTVRYIPCCPQAESGRSTVHPTIPPLWNRIRAVFTAGPGPVNQAAAARRMGECQLQHASMNDESNQACKSTAVPRRRMRRAQINSTCTSSRPIEWCCTRWSGTGRGRDDVREYTHGLRPRSSAGCACYARAQATYTPRRGASWRQARVRRSGPVDVLRQRRLRGKLQLLSGGTRLRCAPERTLLQRIVQRSD